MARYPGATFKPTTWGGRTPRNRQGRGILHVAVSERVSYPPNSGNTWHFYVAKAAPNGATDGSGGPAYCEQYVDTDFRAYGDVDANDDAIVVETAGGMGPSPQLNAERWTRAQELRIADIMRWEAQQPGGAPLELLPDSRAGRRGWGPHRLGIKHSAGPRPGWWQPGGEVWSSALGKECPGDAKVAQVPQIINLARTGQTEDDMTPEQDTRLKNIETAMGASGAAGTPPLANDKNALAVLWGLQRDVAALKASGTTSASVKLPTEFDLSAMARAVADELDRRAHDGNATTGPVS